MDLRRERKRSTVVTLIILKKLNYFIFAVGIPFFQEMGVFEQLAYSKLESQHYCRQLISNAIMNRLQSLFLIIVLLTIVAESLQAMSEDSLY